MTCPRSDIDRAIVIVEKWDDMAINLGEHVKRRAIWDVLITLDTLVYNRQAKTEKAKAILAGFKQTKDVLFVLKVLDDAGKDEDYQLF